MEEHTMTEAILQLKKLVDESDNIVFFGGAGVSTESGIKDFRSVDGLYHQKFKYPPETMLSHSFYESHMEEFYDFYRPSGSGRASSRPSLPRTSMACTRRPAAMRYWSSTAASCAITAAAAASSTA